MTETAMMLNAELDDEFTLSSSLSVLHDISTEIDEVLDIDVEIESSAEMVSSMDELNDILVELEDSGNYADRGDYVNLINKPKIEGVVLIGDRSFSALGLNRITNTELEELLR